MTISVIIPVFNSEKQIKRCLESVLGQSYKDFELIVVDDGSTDKSLEIITEYAQLDRRIKVVSIANSGVSAARNRGICIAVGDYIAFVDSDDYLEIDYLETLVACANSTKGDVIVSDLAYCSRGNVGAGMSKNLSWYCGGHNRLVDLVKAANFSSVIGKLYRTEIIQNIQLRFRDGLSYGEDREFNVRFLACAASVDIIAYRGYYYDDTTVDSLSKQYDKYQLLVDYRYWNLLCGLLRDKQGLEARELSFLSNLLFNFTTDNYHKMSTAMSLKDSMSICQVASKEFRYGFLVRNIRKIAAPKWQKILLLLSPKLLLITYYALKR